jgi:hypothetical protein
MENQEHSILDEVLECIEFGLHDPPQIRRHLDESQRWIELEPIFHILPRGIVTTLSNQTMIPRTTLADWRGHLVRDPD